MRNIEKLIAELTLEEKAGLCSGADFWHTKAVERLGIPALMLSDGPHGLRKQDEKADHLGISESIKAVCFPTGAALASSFDRDLVRSVGRKLGEEAQAEGIHTVLGPAINIKRSPLCGRNFEYLSEDPQLTGELAAAFVEGIQSEGVAACPKHFAANNQEYRRMSISAEVDERTMREIYLPGFEMAVTNAKAWTLMCSYNRINGAYACENEWLLNDVLRDDWGFEGIVMTDWGAMNDRVKALSAGLNLEMPGSRGERDALIVEAVRDGRLEMEVVDKAVRELLRWIDWCTENSRELPPYDKKAHHLAAKDAAAQSAVLLKNNGVLPLSGNQKIVFIGEFAETPRFQGGGSSHINSWKITSAVEAVKDYADITYCKGFCAKQDTSDAVLLKQAVDAARDADVAVIFAGLPDSFESEGLDRKGIDLPSCQNEVISAVCAVQKNTVVALHNGSPVSMPWKDETAGILEMYLAGQASGAAAVELLFGKVNPSGKLAETFPLRIQDTPCYLNFPGTEQEVRYAEGLHVGYRWYDALDKQVLFPFGFGLSYTTFELSDLTLSADTFTGHDTITVSVKIKNTGNLSGKEVVQLYIGFPAEAKQQHPLRQLKGFCKIELSPGEQKTLVFALDKRSFAYYDTGIKDWQLENGVYTVFIGNSSRDLPLSKDIRVRSLTKPRFIVTDNTTVGDVLNNCDDKNLILDLLAISPWTSATEDDRSSLGDAADDMLKSMLDSLPIHALPSFGTATRKEVEESISRISEKLGGEI